MQAGRKVKVVLCEDVASLGAIGETKTVADGFARNFLIPRKMVLPATPSNLKKLESELKHRKLKLSQALEGAQQLAKQIESLSLSVSANAGRDGQLFGSVTNQMISDTLSGNGISIEKKNIVISSPIKTVGEFGVVLRLHPQVTATLKINVVPSSTVKEPAQLAPASTQESPAS